MTTVCVSLFEQFELANRDRGNIANGFVQNLLTWHNYFELLTLHGCKWFFADGAKMKFKCTLLQ